MPIQSVITGGKRSYQKISLEAQKGAGDNKGKQVKNDDINDDERASALDEFNIVYNKDIVSLATNKTSWVIDSDATIHATFWR